MRDWTYANWRLWLAAILTAVVVWNVMARAYGSAGAGWPPTEPAPWSSEP